MLEELGGLSPKNTFFRTHNLLCSGDGTLALKWGELVYQWVKHCIERFDIDEVRSWYWETWNEANIQYWQGTPEEFLKLHDYAINAVRRALPDARVGEPDAAGSGGSFQKIFLEHCLRGTNYATGKTGTLKQKNSTL